MTSDRELLERAAKAAGIDGHYINSRIYPHGEWSGPGGWNPLTDDGDAFRLAVKLSFRVDTDYCRCADVRGRGVTATELLDLDPYAATRRAIVRAAAAMAPTGEPK
jgi:hypothetical protein